MLLSVLIPVYNVENYLDECINSILIQKYKDYEVILIDDGSTDSSGAICDKYSMTYPNMIRVKHKDNQGLLMARRDAIKMAKGDYILFCDSDDFFTPNAFEKLSDVIHSLNPDLVQFDLHYYFKDGSNVSINEGKSFLPSGILQNDTKYLKNCLIDRNYNIWSLASKCVKREFIQTRTDYLKYSHIKYGEDTLQSAEIYELIDNFVYIDDHIYNYRAQSGMTASLPIKYLTDFVEICQYLKTYGYKWGFDRLEQRTNLFVIDAVFNFILNMSENGYNYSKTKYLMKKICENEHFNMANKNNHIIGLLRTPNLVKRSLVVKLLYKRHYKSVYLIMKFKHAVDSR